MKFKIVGKSGDKNADEIAGYFVDESLIEQLMIFLSVMLPMKFNIKQRWVYVKGSDFRIYVDKFFTDKVALKHMPVIREIIYSNNFVIEGLKDRFCEYTLEVLGQEKS